ncbi:MAG TPA: histidine kinase [Gemmatimonadaceae bacterium]|nr:histidine kinase [Gemmatimonadaceae bacterium]
MRARPVLRSFLAAPLWVKLIGANALIVVVAAWALTHAAHHGDEYRRLVEFFFGALFATMAFNVALVVIALRPLRALENAAAEVWRGNTAARVPDSLLADRDMARVGHTINLLVGALVQEGARARELAALVISQAESDHARISHELHESAAQRLAAQVMQISAIARSTTEAHTKVQLEELREVTAETLEQVRLLVRTMNAPVVHAWPEAADLDDEHASNPAERDALAGRG